MLDNINSLLKSYSPTPGGSRRHTFQQYMEKDFLRGAPESLKSSRLALLCRLDITVRTEVTELENFNETVIIGLWDARAKQQHSIIKERWAFSL